MFRTVSETCLCDAMRSDSSCQYQELEPTVPSVENCLFLIRHLEFVN